MSLYGFLEFLFFPVTSIWFLVSFLFWLGVKRTPLVSKLSDLDSNLPKLSVIIAAKDEEKEIEKSVRTLLNQDYPDFEIIVVNDRSADQTENILKRLTDEFSNLKIQTIQILPEKWLGKNHALWVGANSASGEFLLFTDADIRFSKHCLRKIVADVKVKQIQFASCLPEFETKSFFENVFNLTFATLLSIRIKFWWVSKPYKSAFCGVGAFNLVEKKSYFGMGGHEKLKLEVADDLVLAKLMKAFGAKSAMYSGKNELSVSWQSGGLKSSIKGIEKNAFSGFNYSWLKMIPQLLGLTVISLFPFFGFFFGWEMGILGIFPLIMIYYFNQHFQQKSAFYFITFPVGVFFFIYAVLKSALKITQQGSVNWRETKYDKEILKKESLL